MTRVPSDLDRLLGSADMLVDPYPVYARLREEAPVGWSESLGGWVVSRYSEVNASLRDKENLSNENRQGLLLADMTPEEMKGTERLRHYFAQKDVIGADPPDHARLRMIVQKAFTPKMVSSIEPRVKELAGSLVGELKREGRGDFVSVVAHPLPVILIAEMLGAPPEDRALFKRWSADILAFQGVGRTTYAAASVSQTALLELFAYMSELIDDRRRNPRENLITVLANAEADGARLSRDELLATCNTLLTAGHETTTNLIGNLVHLLLAERSRWEAVQRDAALVPTAVEEALRYDAPKQRNFRRIKRTHEFAGQKLEAEQMVFQLIGSANRDERGFANAGKFDVRRSPNPHLSFGSGIHFCLGGPLARLEARIVLETLLAELPGLELEAAGVEWQERVQFRGPKVLRVRMAG